MDDKNSQNNVNNDTLIKYKETSHSHIFLFIGVMESIIKTIISLDKK